MLYFLYFNCGAFAAVSRENRRGFGDAPGSRLDVTTLVPAITEALSMEMERHEDMYRSGGSDTDETRNERRGVASFVLLPLLTQVTNDANFVETARRLGVDSAIGGVLVFDSDVNRADHRRGTGAAKPEHDEATHQSNRPSVLTKTFQTLAKVTRSGGSTCSASCAKSPRSERGADSAYARSLALGGLSNIASRVVGVDAQTASRLVGALDAFERKERSLRDGGAAGETQTETQAQTETHALWKTPPSLQALVFGELVAATLEVLNKVVTNASASNPELVYALLHRMDLFEPRASDCVHDDDTALVLRGAGEGFVSATPEVEAWFEKKEKESGPGPTRREVRLNLRSCLAFLDAQIDRAVGNTYVTAEKVMAIASRAAAQFSVDKVPNASRFRETEYEYCEFPHARESFHAPNAWRLVVEHEGVEWHEGTTKGLWG